VEYVVAAFHASLKRPLITQVAHNVVSWQVVDIVGPARGSHQEAQVGAVLQQPPRDMTPEKACRSCDETSHSAFKKSDRKFELGRAGTQVQRIHHRAIDSNGCWR
jgi:hypothetical protein